MRTIKNTLKKLEIHVIIGLTFTITTIVPCLLFIIKNIIQGNFQNW